MSLTAYRRLYWAWFVVCWGVTLAVPPLSRHHGLTASVEHFGPAEGELHLPPHPKNRF